MKSELYYVHDPMCSWCWGFAGVAKELFHSLPEQVTARRLLGGLAADSDQSMTAEMQANIQLNWQRIENKIPAVRFNFDFWRVCAPRRSTYPACRAVIAARQQGEQFDEIMTAHIQQAYYREARNPSDEQVLVELAGEIGLDLSRFKQELVADRTHKSLLDEIRLSKALHADSFPGLLFKAGDSAWPVAIDYLDSSPMLELIEMFLQMEEPS